MCTRDLNLDLNFEFTNLASTDSVDSAQAAAVTSHKDWCETKSMDVSVQRGRSSLLSLGLDQKQKREDERQKRENEKTQKVQTAFQRYHEQGEEARKSDHQTGLIEIDQI